jgi:predicted MFS family arabinose efflux permease
VPWQFYAVFASLSTISSFFVPAQTVTTPLIVPRESLMAASAAMQQAFQAVRLVSPAVAGALAGTLGERSCFIADFASFIASALLITSIAIPHDRPHMNRDLRSVVAELNSGLIYVLTHPVISFVVLALAAGTFAISAFGSLLAVYVRDVLHAGPSIFGATGAMVGAGMLGGSFFIAPAARKMEHPARLMLLGLLVESLAAAALAATHQTPLALLECVLVGIGAALIIVPGGALLQSEPAPEMRGRVSGIWLALICAAQAIAVFFAGDIAARVGIANLYFGSAVLLTLFAGVGWLRLRQLT